MIALETDVTVESLEAAASKLGTTASNQLQIPTNLRSRMLGNQAALTQFVVTWARRQRTPTLVTYENQLAAGPEAIPNLLETPHGLAAGLLASRIESGGGERNPQQLVGSAYRRFLSPEVKGERLSLLVSDLHPFAPKTAPFLQLAPTDLALRAARKETFISDFRVHLKKCFVTAGAVPFQDIDALRILETVYELLANTEEWASSDLDRKPFEKSVRGILSEILSVKTIANQLSSSKYIWPPLSRYLQALINDPKVAATHFLEISVFDSGIGLARRDLKRPLDDSVSTDLEYASVLNCLRKHGTSSSDSSRGMGLFEVMRLLTRLKGFLRLRTGRLGLFRDFVEDKFILDDDWRERVRGSDFYRGFEYLWDWDVDPQDVRMDPNVFVLKKKRTQLEGALFTVWIPLRLYGVQLPLL